MLIKYNLLGHSPGPLSPQVAEEECLGQKSG